MMKRLLWTLVLFTVSGCTTTASQTPVQMSAPTYNTVVLSNPHSTSWFVYLLAATKEPAKIMVGGHYRITVSSDGASILKSEPLSRSCLVIDKTQIPKDAREAFHAMTHIVSDTPVETHVFLSLLHRAKLIVFTRLGTWEIEGDTIQYSKEAHKGMEPTR